MGEETTKTNGKAELKPADVLDQLRQPLLSVDGIRMVDAAARRRQAAIRTRSKWMTQLRRARLRAE